MTITAVSPDETVTAGTARRDLVGAFHEFGIWLEEHPDAEGPDSPVINKRVKGRNRAEKLVHLRRIAASWRVPVIELPDGTLIAERVFGPLTFEAHVPPEPGSHADYLARMRAAAAASAVAVAA